MNGKMRFILGGLGGLAPVIALLAVVDFERNVQDATTIKMVGYFLRVLALFAIGGLVAWLHENEIHKFKLFEIGLGAPALVAGLIAGAQATPGAQQKPPAPSAPVAHLIDWVPLGAAHAQPALPARPEIKKFAPPKPSPGSEFLEGLLGVKPANSYYVIAGSYLNYDEAKAAAARLSAKKAGAPAQIYAPYGGNPYYAVVVGEQLRLPEAKEVQAAAIASGAARDTFIWSPQTAPAVDPVEAARKGPWGVVISGDSKLADAQQEKKAGPGRLNVENVDIFLRDGSYRGVAVYENKSKAEDALARAQGKKKDAYLVDMGRWCPLRAHRDDYQECVNF